MTPQQAEDGHGHYGDGDTSFLVLDSMDKGMEFLHVQAFYEKAF